MQPQAPFTGDADGPFERVLCHLVVARGLRLSTLTPDLAVGAYADTGRLVVLARYVPKLRPELTAVLKQAREVGVEVVMVGGGPTGARALRAALPWFSGQGIAAWHLDGEVKRLTSRSGRTYAFLKDPPPPDWPRFWQAMEGAMAQVEREAREAQVVRTALADRRPVATLALLVSFGLVFLAELAVGAHELPPAAYRMGALARDAVMAGEVWRLASATFLHGSVVHLAFNAAVTWGLGSVLERILGTARFCLLYATCALAGSLLSLVFLGDRYSVGASGALWGLMAAQGVLSLRGQGILPAPMLASMRAGAGQNLVLNIVNSVRPGVDWAAHAGGGLAGALLALLGLVTVGMPRWADSAGGGPPPDRVPGAVRAGAVLAMALLVAGGLMGLLGGRVWTLHDRPAFAPATVQGWTTELPQGLEPKPGAPGAELLGDLLHDPAVVGITSGRFDAPLSPEQLDAETEAAIATFSDAGEGVLPDTPLHRAEGAHLIVGSFRTGELRMERAVTLRPDGFVMVDVMAWEAAAPAWAGVAERVARGVR